MPDERESNRDFFAAGDRFRGYAVERALGRGGIGAVYLVRHEMLDSPFAMKILYPDVAASNDDFVKRFVREAKLASRIRHPNLVAVHDAGYDEQRGLYYLVMDYVPGVSVRESLAMEGRIDPSRAALIAVQVASALAAAQQYHVVHRDIKPENIMVTKDGTAKLVDLGVAKADNVHDSFKTVANTVFGTPAYVAPEQAVDASRVDTRADIYSLGVVLFEMVSGERPYKGDSAGEILRQVLSDSPIPDVRQVAPDVPEELAALIARMCDKNPENRPLSPQALVEEFARIGVKTAAIAAAEYAPEEEPDAGAIDIASLPPPVADDGKFSTTDEEINRFIKQRNAKKRRAQLLRYMLELAALAAAAVALAVFCR